VIRAGRSISGREEDIVVSPEERDILEEHAAQAAFLWAIRDAASGDVLYDLSSLCDLDERLEAHLDGLRLGGAEGLEIAEATLDDVDPGTAFTATVLAVEGCDLRGIARLLDWVERRPALARGFEAALGWAPAEAFARISRGLLASSCPPGVQALGLAGCAWHRADPGPALDLALHASDPRLRGRALSTAGKVGRMDLEGAVRQALRAGEEDEACRFAAAWTGALWRQPEAAGALAAMAEGGGAFAERAAAMAARGMPQGAARGWLLGLGRAGGAQRRAALAGAAALGDAGLVPWLIEQMGEPATARLAGGAMARITGADFVRDELAGRAPKGFVTGPTEDPEDEDVAMDPDESLPWPDVAAAQRWWSGKESAFQGDARYLLGRPMDAEGLEEVLRGGDQQARAGAAVELCLLKKRRVVFEVRGRGERQREALG
jgi:uncharacterized protein (TIGR02270 family)